MVTPDVPVAENFPLAIVIILLRVVIIQRIVAGGAPRISEVYPPNLFQDNPVVVDLLVRRRRLLVQPNFRLARVDPRGGGQLFLAVDHAAVDRDIPPQV